jgi:hypothetical protein
MVQIIVLLFTLLAEMVHRKTLFYKPRVKARTFFRLQCTKLEGEYVSLATPLSQSGLRK